MKQIGPDMKTADEMQLVRVDMTDDLIDGRPAFQVYAAALPKDQAVEAVGRRVSRYWTATLMKQGLSPRQLGLTLEPGEICRLGR